MLDMPYPVTYLITLSIFMFKILTYLINNVVFIFICININILSLRNIIKTHELELSNIIISNLLEV